MNKIFYVQIMSLMVLSNWSCNTNDPSIIQPCYGLPTATQLPVDIYELPLTGKYVKNLMTYQDKLILISEKIGTKNDEVLIYDKYSKNNITLQADKASDYVLLGGKLYYTQMTAIGPLLKSIDLLSGMEEDLHLIEVPITINYVPLIDDLQVFAGELYYVFKDFDNFKLELYKWDIATSVPILVTSIPFVLVSKVVVFRLDNGQLGYACIYEENINGFQYQMDGFALPNNNLLYRLDGSLIASSFSYELGFNNEILFNTSLNTSIYDIRSGQLLINSPFRIKPFCEEISYNSTAIIDPLTGKELLNIAPYSFDTNATPLHFDGSTFYMKINQKSKILNMASGCFEDQIILDLGEAIMYENISEKFYSINGNIIKEYQKK